MKLAFEDINTPSYIKEAVKNLIEKDATSNGNIIIEELSDEDAELYDDSEEFVKKHIDTDDLYMVYQCVAGAWNQPLTMVAVVEY